MQDKVKNKKHYLVIGTADVFRMSGPQESKAGKKSNVGRRKWRILMGGVGRGDVHRPAKIYMQQ